MRLQISDSGSKDPESGSEVGPDEEVSRARHRVIPDRSLFKEGFKFPANRTCMQPTMGPSTMLPLGVLAEHAYDGRVSVSDISGGANIDDLF